MEEYWARLVTKNDVLEGEIRYNTFHPNDFTKNITRNYLAKLFEEKFLGKKEIIVAKQDGKTHQKTRYHFSQKNMQNLARKYNVSIPSSLFSSGQGSHGGLDNVDHVDHF